MPRNLVIWPCDCGLTFALSCQSCLCGEAQRPQYLVNEYGDGPETAAVEGNVVSLHAYRMNKTGRN